ncbi:hypothetical protein N7516_009116 [Penicillium verrucosum]|uniref:uncharacterized protein n=1 Tax=Penicillium verrucosum TaxID=60171 RepID=UPI002544F248|nr:uncharacterized protein N7516_009116 [Penicillium verrucosum]KAJ5927343.1 hypothetical protein N7516_009116 [Penicillium verrucosum]
MPSLRRCPGLGRIIVAAFLIWMVLSSRQRIRKFISSEVYSHALVNSTLGFERIMVISTGDSGRIQGIINASMYTGLQLDIPYQESWSLDVAESFRRNKMQGLEPKTGIGQTQCWLGHLNVLREVVHQSITTALIFEDDVDWDVAIKKEIGLVGPLLHQIWPCDGDDNTPYGTCWDILWLGHCGDLVPRDALSISDDTSLPSSIYEENDGEPIPFPAQLRMVHVSQGPVCTYAYAVTKQSAYKLIHMVGDGIDETTSTQLRLWCQDGSLRCITSYFITTGPEDNWQVRLPG